MSQAPTQTETALDHSVEDLLKQVEQGAREIADTLALEQQPAPQAPPAAATAPAPAADEPAAAPQEHAPDEAASAIDSGVAAALQDAKQAAVPAVPASAVAPHVELPAEPAALDAALAAKAAAAVEDEFHDPAVLVADGNATTPTTSGATQTPLPSVASSAVADVDADEGGAASEAHAPEPAPTVSKPPQAVEQPGHAPASAAEHAPGESAAPAVHPAAAAPAAVRIIQTCLFKLASLPAPARQTVGWVALGTLFWAGVVWIWALMFVGAPAPSHDETDPEGAKHLVGVPGEPEHAAPVKKAAPKHAASSGSAEHGGAGHH